MTKYWIASPVAAVPRLTVNPVVDCADTPKIATVPLCWRKTSGVTEYAAPNVSAQDVERVPVVILPVTSFDDAESVPPEGEHVTVGVLGVLEAVRCP